MEKTDVFANVLIALHAATSLRKRISRDLLAMLIYISTYVLEEKKFPVFAVSPNNIEMPDIQILISMLIKNGIISENRNGYLSLTDKAQYIVSDYISSRKKILSWKLTYYLCKFSDKTIRELVKYLASEDTPSLTIAEDEAGILHELITALQSIARRDKTAKIVKIV